jgi:AcrR family transcriptional regulator
VPAEASKRSRRNSYDDLVDVATALFSKHGYEGTTVRMIADELGVQSGSLYSHISSKDEILKRIVYSAAGDFFEGARVASESGGTPEERLRALCRSHLEVLDRRKGAVTVYYDEWRRLDEASIREIAGQRRDYELLFRSVVDEGVAAGEFAPVDVRTTVLVLLSALNWTYQWYSPQGAKSPAEIADGYLDVVLTGLFPR